jgi:hypothetical protein
MNQQSEALAGFGFGPGNDLDEMDHFYGKYRGEVVDNQDPDNLGRVMVRVREVLGDVPSGWAWPCVPYTGAQVGLFAIPPIGAGVWIEFEAGDTSRPIWTGGWWSAGEVPPQPMGVQTLPFTKILRSDAGLILAMNDSEQRIVISDKDGRSQVEVHVLPGMVTVKGAARIVLDAPRVQEGSQAAAHPAVLGDELLTYLTTLVNLLTTHIHPGETAASILPVTPAPPLPPLPSPPQSLLSLKVLLE